MNEDKELDKLFWRDGPGGFDPVGLDNIDPLCFQPPPTHIIIEETGQVLELGKMKPRDNPLLKKPQ